MLLKWVAMAGAILALMACWYFLPLGGWLRDLTGWIRVQGALGYVLLGAMYVVATLLMMPGSLLTLAVGVTFGFWGFPLAVISATAGACLAFLAGRYVVCDAVLKRYRDNRRFKAIDTAIKDDGWKIVGLLRISPLIPFNLQNYVLGITAVKFRHYLVATFFGIMPGTFMFVYFGAAGQAALRPGGDDSSVTWPLTLMGLMATIVVTVLVTRKARARLDAATQT